MLLAMVNVPVQVRSLFSVALAVWVDVFQVKLEKVWPIPLGIELIAPITSTVEPAFQAAVGIVPLVKLCWYLLPLLNTKVEVVLPLIVPELVNIPPELAVK